MVSRDDIRGQEAETVAALAYLETELITIAADAVKDVLTDTNPFGWWRLHAMRIKSRQLINQMVDRAVEAGRRAVGKAATAGKQAAEAELRARLLAVVPTMMDQIVAADAARQLDSTIHATLPHAISSTDTMYSKVMTALAAQPIHDEATRTTVAQHTLDELTAAGVTGFVDRKGRHWNLVSYIDMATRAVLFDTALRSHTATLQANGQDLVVISTAIACCPKCAPFEGAIVSISGNDPDAEYSLEEIRAAGWGHPRCRCSIHHWQVGDETPSILPAESPQQYQAKQRLRALERLVRQTKRQRAAALTVMAKTAANLRIRALQAKIRHHTARTGTSRRRDREQIGRAYQ